MTTHPTHTLSVTVSALALLTALVAGGCADGSPLKHPAQALREVTAALHVEQARAGHLQLALERSQPQRLGALGGARPPRAER